MRYPEFLRPNGKIGYIAPSFGASSEPYISRIMNAMKKFEKMGFINVPGPNCFEGSGIGKSNTPEKCGAEINDFFINDRSDVIISCGGGETMCEDLQYVDFEAIRNAKPKWFMGFSDNTNLTFLLPTLCDTAAVYGPCAGSFGMEQWHRSLYDAFDILTGKMHPFSNYDMWEKESAEDEGPLDPYNLTEPFSMRIEAEGGEAEFSGRLLGGCLDILSILCGTCFDRVKEFSKKYEKDGIVWFLEACELTPMSIRRVMWQLDSSGWFENAKGFIIGRPFMYDADGMGLDRFSAVTGVVEKYNVPVIFDVDIGHLPPMMPIISGALADVSAKGNDFTVSYRLL